MTPFAAFSAQAPDYSTLDAMELEERVDKMDRRRMFGGCAKLALISMNDWMRCTSEPCRYAASSKFLF
jgi:hypothetical protein